MNLVRLELGPLGYLLLLVLAGTLFFWLRRWLGRRWRSGAAVTLGAAVLAFGLTVLLWALLLLPTLLTQRALAPAQRAATR